MQPNCINHYRWSEYSLASWSYFPILPYCIYFYKSPRSPVGLLEYTHIWECKSTGQEHRLWEFPGGWWLGLCTFTAEGPGSIPGQGTKILQAARRAQKTKTKKRTQPLSPGSPEAEATRHHLSALLCLNFSASLLPRLWNGNNNCTFSYAGSEH